VDSMGRGEIVSLHLSYFRRNLHHGVGGMSISSHVLTVGAP
jgi:hypothetical protein